MLKVSVVIPTWNRAGLVAQTIEKIEHQTLPRDLYEVLVIDNKSTDDTQSVLKQKSRSYPNLKIFSQSKKGAAATRNVGIQKASGEIILFIDDDIQAEPNLIEAHWNYHQQHSSSSIIGGLITPWANSRNAFLRYLRDRGIFNPYSIACGPMDFSYYHTGNVSTARSVLLEVGGFNEEFEMYGMEDIELGYRLERHGSRMVHGPDAKAVHEFFPTYPQFIQRCEQAGYSLGKMIELHPELRGRFVESGKRT
ncbi:MAG TPA: glycosyltransferase, partial [Terriglobia bacterium]|nr:glycosyltransferase [Terriglobia bacterium]